MHKDLENLWLPYTQMRGLYSILKAQKTSSSKIFLDNGNLGGFDKYDNLIKNNLNFQKLVNNKKVDNK